MRKVIVSTTINPPTKAIKRFQNMKGWDLVVVGDLKTPKNYKLDEGTYLTPAMQEAYDKKLSDAIGWNCIQRRNFGVLYAHDKGADIVALVDDDNIPLDNWGKNLMVGRSVEVNYYDAKISAFDPVGATNYKHLWHRGYPLQLLAKRDYSMKKKKRITPDIQADFWNGDPDIDAICRMEHAPEVKFQNKFFPIASNKISPFNSQNTFLNKKVLRDYFLFTEIGRMDDIWAAYRVQALGFKVVFGKPSVYQLRNPHDLTIDLKQEILGYVHNSDIVEKIFEYPDMVKDFVSPKAWKAFELYQKHFN